MSASSEAPSVARANVSGSRGVECPKLRLNHPKNYLGVPYAVKSDGDTGSLVMANLTSMAGAAKMGAQALGLLDANGEVTPWAEGHLSVVRTKDSDLAYLKEFQDLRGQGGRFISQRPEWRQSGEAIARQYPATNPIIDVLDQYGALTLPALVERLVPHHWGIVSDIFLKSSAADSPGDVTFDLLTNSDVYRGAGVCQLKGVLYHLGVVTTPGASTDYLTPTRETWKLESDAAAGGGY